MVYEPTKTWKTGDKCKVRCIDGKWRKAKIVLGTVGNIFFKIYVKKLKHEVVATWSQIKPRKKRK